MVGLDECGRNWNICIYLLDECGRSRNIYTYIFIYLLDECGRRSRNIHNTFIVCASHSHSHFDLRVFRIFLGRKRRGVYIYIKYSLHKRRQSHPILSVICLSTFWRPLCPTIYILFEKCGLHSLPLQ